MIQFPCFRGILIWLFLNRNSNFVTVFYVMMTSKNNLISEAIPLLFPVYAYSVFQERCWHRSCCFCSWGRISWSVVQGSKSSVCSCEVTHPAVISQISLWWKVQPRTWGRMALRSSSNLAWLHWCGFTWALKVIFFSICCSYPPNPEHQQNPCLLPLLGVYKLNVLTSLLVCAPWVILSKILP